MELYWTLSLELIFYFICSGLFLSGLLNKSRLIAWGVTLLSIAIFLVCLFVIHRPAPFGRLLLLVVAFAASYLHLVFVGKCKLSGFLYFLPILLFAIALGAWLRFEAYPPDRSSEIAFTFLCVVISWFSAIGVFFVLFFVRNLQFPRFLLYLGTISYSLYLVHPFAIHFIPKSLPPGVWIPAVVISSIALSMATYRFIELPAITVGRAITSRMRTASSR